MNNLIKSIQKLKRQGKKIGFCWGAFDLLHPGHVRHLEEAKKICEVLVVGITSDKNIKLRKGLGRPIFNEKLRAYLVGQIKPVDFVFINTDSHAINAIKKIKPHFCIKGGDYADPGRPQKNQPLEEAAAAAVGAQFLFTKTGQFTKIKTTGIIKKIKTREI